MASKAALLLVVTLIFVATSVSSNEDQKHEMKMVTYPKVPVTPPTSSAAPPTSSAPPPVKPPVITPPKVQPPTAHAGARMPPVRTIKDCEPLCGERCKLHSRPRLCIRACITCCDRCKCVPPGTYGNREKCGKCYTDMTTHGNKIECP